MGVTRFSLEYLSRPITRSIFMQHVEELAYHLRFDADIKLPQIYTLSPHTSKLLFHQLNDSVMQHAIKYGLESFTQQHWDAAVQRVLHINKGDFGGEFFMAHYDREPHKLFYQSHIWNDLKELERHYSGEGRKEDFRVLSSSSGDAPAYESHDGVGVLS